MLAPDIVHLPIFLQGGLGQGQRLGMGDELLVVQVQVGMVGRWGALRWWWQRRRRGHVEGAAGEIIQALGLQQAGWLAVRAWLAVLHHHVVHHAGLEAAVLQLLHALVLQRAVLAVGRERQATTGHPHTHLAAGPRTRLRNAATAHSQEMPIDLGLWGHVGRGSP